MEYNIKEPEFTIRLEIDKTKVIVHIPEFSKLTPSVYKKFGARIYELLEFFQGQGYEGLLTGILPKNTKLVKLATLLGAEYLYSLDNGYDIYRLV